MFRDAHANIIYVVLFLGSLFFVLCAGFELAHDDVLWLQGRFPAPDDCYRMAPMACLSLLGTVFGLAPMPLYLFVFGIHLVNSWLVCQLARKLTGHRSAGLAAFSVFLVNPLTFQVLAWPSSLSYELGTTCALTALLCWHRAATCPVSRSAVWWLTATAISYGTGLMSSHDTVVTPLLMGTTVLCARKKIALPEATFILALLLSGTIVSASLYPFVAQYHTLDQLLSLDFATDFLSAVASFPITLVLAYPFAFFIEPECFLPGCLANETLRWIMTLVVLGVTLLPCHPRSLRNLTGLLTVSCAVVITPHLIRLYLTPPAAHYAPSYLVWGRVLYFPFSVLAIFIGHVYARTRSENRSGFPSRILVFLWIASVLHALLFLYGENSFPALMRSSTEPGSIASDTSPWHPFDTTHTVWLTAVGLLILVFATVRFLLRRRWTEKRPFTEGVE